MLLTISLRLPCAALFDDSAFPLPKPCLINLPCRSPPSSLPACPPTSEWAVPPLLRPVLCPAWCSLCAQQHCLRYHANMLLQLQTSHAACLLTSCPAPLQTAAFHPTPTPPYSLGSYTAGIAAPILLTILRLLQGLAMVRGTA